MTVSSRKSGWSEAASDVMLDLLAPSYWRPNPRKKSADLGERWQRSVRELVDDNLQDSELGAAWIAPRLGVGPRYAQMLLAGMATTASAYILARCLDHDIIDLARRMQAVVVSLRAS